jgi:hypothetical protein
MTWNKNVEEVINLMDTEDNWLIRMAKADLARWDERVNRAKELGNDALLTKALKYKMRYEQRLAELRTDFSEIAPVRETLDEPRKCVWCAFFAEYHFFLDRPASANEEIMQQARTNMGVSQEECRKKCSDFASYIVESSACEDCMASLQNMTTILDQLAGD